MRVSRPPVRRRLQSLSSSHWHPEVHREGVRDGAREVFVRRRGVAEVVGKGWWSVFYSTRRVDHLVPRLPPDLVISEGGLRLSGLLLFGSENRGS